MAEVEKNQRFVVVCRLIKCSIKLEDTIPLRQFTPGYGMVLVTDITPGYGTVIVRYFTLDYGMVIDSITGYGTVLIRNSTPSYGAIITTRSRTKRIK